MTVPKGSRKSRTHAKIRGSEERPAEAAHPLPVVPQERARGRRPDRDGRFHLLRRMHRRRCADRRGAQGWANRIGPPLHPIDFEADQSIGTERAADGNIAASRPRAMSTRPIRGTLLRGSKVYPRRPRRRRTNRRSHRRIGWRQADITEIARAAARRNVQTAAEGDSQVGVVAADAPASSKNLFAVLLGLARSSRRRRDDRRSRKSPGRAPVRRTVNRSPAAWDK